MADSNLFLALSCLQGRLAAEAADDLLSLGPVGLQLTPGCAPSPGLKLRLEDSGITIRTHHGYSERAIRRRVWSPEGQRLTADDSVHAPATSECTAAAWADWSVANPHQVTEIMYPGHWLGTGAEIAMAMTLRLPLAVDISHVAIQRATGVLSNDVHRRLMDYDLVPEIHVSQNKGARDCHAPLDDTTNGLAWARERAADGVPLILECYMHKLSTSQRVDQIGMLSP